MDEYINVLEPLRPTRRGRALRIGLVGAAAAALVAVGILAVGLSLSPAGTLAAGSTSGSSTPAIPLDGGGPGFRGHGGGPGFGMPGGDITITKIAGSSISLATPDGWTRTITVDSGTTVTKAGATINLTDLAVGDEIRFQQTRESDGSYTIDSIAVILPSASGTVSAISGSTITLDRPDGSTTSVTVTGTTTYTVNGTSGKGLSDVSVGMRLMAEGTSNADGSLTASAIRAGDADSFRPGGRGPWMHGPDDGDGPAASTAPAASATAG